MSAIMDPRVREREYLLAIGRALTAELELSEVLRVILHASAELVSSQVGVVILAEPTAQVFRAAATYGIPTKVLEEFMMLAQGISYDEGKEKDALNLVKSLVKRMAEATDSQLTESLGLPMYRGDAIIGAIFVFHSHQFYVNPNLARFLQSFAAQAAIAVSNAQLYEAVNREKQRLNAILQQSADGVMILDPSMRITVFNHALSQMTGISIADAVGKMPEELVQWDRLRSQTDLKDALEDGWPYPDGSPLYVEGDIKRSDGKVSTLGVTYAPLLSARGQMTSIIANVRDLTRFREEQDLHKTFISVISHELKTPVSIIKGYAGTMQRPDANWPKEVVSEYMTTIIEEADHLTGLIDNLLEASRLQAGTFDLNISDDVSLARLARNVARKFSEQTDMHEVQLSFSADFPSVPGDERRIVQVFNNLLSNAIKYSPEGGAIKIWGDVYPDYVTVSVMDHGIGIPEHEQHRIFQQFSRLDNALSRRTEGTGLGLFLTKAIVEAHQGQIWFESCGEKPGTIFTFSLPLHRLDR